MKTHFQLCFKQYFINSFFMWILETQGPIWGKGKKERKKEERKRGEGLKNFFTNLYILNEIVHDWCCWQCWTLLLHKTPTNWDPLISFSSGKKNHLSFNVFKILKMFMHFSLKFMQILINFPVKIIKSNKFSLDCKAPKQINVIV